MALGFSICLSCSSISSSMCSGYLCPLARDLSRAARNNCSETQLIFFMPGKKMQIAPTCDNAGLAVAATSLPSSNMRVFAVRRRLSSATFFWCDRLRARSSCTHRLFSRRNNHTMHTYQLILV